MIEVELHREDLLGIMTDVRNLPGLFFAGSSPIIRPFLDRMESLLPDDKRGRGTAYILSALRTHADVIRADEVFISIQSEERVVDIGRQDLHDLMCDKFPAMRHQELNLPGLLFLQSGPALQTAVIRKLREAGIAIPDGRRTQRYIFHMAVVSLDADLEHIRIRLDMDRLPPLPGSRSKEMVCD